MKSKIFLCVILFLLSCFSFTSSSQTLDTQIYDAGFTEPDERAEPSVRLKSKRATCYECNLIDRDNVTIESFESTNKLFRPTLSQWTDFNRRVKNLRWNLAKVQNINFERLHG